MLLEIVSPEATLFKGKYLYQGRWKPILNNHAPIVSQQQGGSIAATSFNLVEVAGLFTKVNEQIYTLAISSGTIEMKDNKVIVLAD
jgi:F-type H+-transporting ATPase subunit epsilon